LRSALATAKAEIELALDEDVPPHTQALAAVDRALELLANVEAAVLGAEPIAPAGASEVVEPVGKVIVVDDDTRQASLLVRQLERLGFAATASSDLRGVTGRVSGRDTLVVDYSLLQGVDEFTAAAVRAAQPIVISGAVGQPAADRARSFGATAYLVKPVRLDDLVSLLKSRRSDSPEAAP
jgi:ActR/RegA family two-component response regulator